MDLSLSSILDPSELKILKEHLNPEELELFLNRASKKEKSRRSVLILVWMFTISRKMEKVRVERKGLQLTFLIIMCESIANLLYKKEKLSPQKRFSRFLDFISPTDKTFILNSIKKFPEEQRIAWRTFVSAMYGARSRLVHEGIFFDLFFNDIVDEERSHYQTITSFYIWNHKKQKSRRMNISLSLSYKKLEEIFVRTAINNIRASY